MSIQTQHPGNPQAPAAPQAPATLALRHARRSAWLKTLLQWHWISSALCLIGMVLFAFTGITLNHAGSIEAKPQITTREGTLPTALLASLNHLANQTDTPVADAPLPEPVRGWLRSELGIPTRDTAAEWSADEVYLAMPRPGGDAWLRIDLGNGELEYEHTDRGWISYLNDLHKGRHSGIAWSWFIDIFAAACLVFSLTGLLLLYLHASHRPTTWPLIALGAVIPVLLALLFIH